MNKYEMITAIVFIATIGIILLSTIIGDVIVDIKAGQNDE